MAQFNQKRKSSLRLVLPVIRGVFLFVSSRFKAKKVKKALKPKSVTTIPGRLTFLQRITKFPKSLILVIDLNFFSSHNFYTL